MLLCCPSLYCRRCDLCETLVYGPESVMWITTWLQLDFAYFSDVSGLSIINAVSAQRTAQWRMRSDRPCVFFFLTVAYGTGFGWRIAKLAAALLIGIERAIPAL